MAKRRLSAILAAVIGGLFLAGCQCNQQQWPGIYENFSGADWQTAMKDCSLFCAQDRDPSYNSDLSSLSTNFDGADWRAAKQDCHLFCAELRNPIYNCDLSSLKSTFDGADWVDNVAGSCPCPAGCAPLAPGR